jgi:hypothetical protein
MSERAQAKMLEVFENEFIEHVSDLKLLEPPDIERLFPQTGLRKRLLSALEAVKAHVASPATPAIQSARVHVVSPATPAIQPAQVHVVSPATPAIQPAQVHVVSPATPAPPTLAAVSSQPVNYDFDPCGFLWSDSDDVPVALQEEWAARGEAWAREQKQADQQVDSSEDDEDSERSNSVPSDVDSAVSPAGSEHSSVSN